MPYTPDPEWQDGTTPITAAKLNNMESGIEEGVSDAAAAEADAQAAITAAATAQTAANNAATAASTAASAAASAATAAATASTHADTVVATEAARAQGAESTNASAIATETTNRGTAVSSEATTRASADTANSASDAARIRLEQSFLNPMMRQHRWASRIQAVTTDITTYANTTTPDASLTKSYTWPNSGITTSQARLLTSNEIAALPIQVVGGRPNVYVSAGVTWMGGYAGSSNIDGGSFWPYTPAPTYRFMADGNKVDVTLWALIGTTLASHQVFVDGYPVNLAPQTLTAAATYLHLIFPSAKPRLIEIRTDMFLGPINTGPLYTVWQPTAVRKPRVMVTGASYVAPTVWNSGTGAATLNLYGMWQSMGDYLDIEDMWVEGVSGTGFITRAGSGVGNPNNNFVDRVSGAVAAAPDLLIVADGFDNDSYNSQTASAIATAANGYFNTLRAALPNSKFAIMTGVRAPLYGDFNTNFTASIAALQALRSDIYYINSGLWFDASGGYTPGHTNGLGNTDLYIGNDGVHPTAEGHQYLRGRMASKVQRVLYDDGTLLNTVIT